MNNNFPTYITHYKGNTERRLLMQKILEVEKFENVNWITDFDRQDISYIDYVNSFQADHLEHQKRGQDPNEFYPHYPLQPEVVSLCLKHKECLRLISLGTAEYGIVFEDDAIIEENFIEQFLNYFKTLPSDWEVAFFGQGGGKHISVDQLEPNKNWYLKNHPADRCADAILFKKEAAAKIFAGMTQHKICFAADAELAFWFKVFNMKVYWLEPPIVTQGSQIGIFQSIQPPRSAYVNKQMPTRKDLANLIQQVHIDVYDKK